MILDPIDRALEKIYARRRRIALITSLVVFGLVGVLFTAFPDLLKSVMKVPTSEGSGDDSELSKHKKKIITKKKRKPMPKKLEKQVKKKKKDQLKKRMLTAVKKMKKQVASLEKIEQMRMDELEKLRDPKEDMLEQIKEVAEIVKDKAHLFNNKDTSKEAEEMDKEARELAEKINEELDKVAAEKKPAGEKPSNEEELNKLAEQAEDLAKRLDEASKQTDSDEAKDNAEDASMAAEDMAESLKDLAENDFSEMNKGLADNETNPLRSEERPLEELSIEELHDLSQDLAAQATDLNSDIKAAENAKKKDQSFNDALASQENSEFEKNKLDSDLSKQMNPSSESLDDVEQLKKDAMRGIQLATSTINRTQREADPSMRAAALAAAMQGGLGGDGTGVGGRKSRMGEGSGGMSMSGKDDDLREVSGGEFNEGPMKWREALVNSQYHFSNEQLRDILPARRFSKNALRKGWFYIDTWYVIGPWKAPWANGRVDYRVVFPPEDSIDLSANYGIGADGEQLTWKFKQFDSVLMAMDPQWRNSAHYLYTELYFEEARDMVLCVAADDTAKVWINDQVAIEEDTMSDWALNESFRKVRFHRGFNKVLVRCQNGPGENDLSVILVAEDIVLKK